jgi:DNA-binding transcriptional LysR family regulator
MDPRRLVLFAEVVERGSFTRAAQALHLTQPSLSRQLGSLEREAGTRLLNRHPAGVTPTAAGRVVLEHAQAVRAHTETAARRLDEQAVGRLRIAAFPTAVQTLVIEAAAELRAQRAGFELVVEEAAHQAAIGKVRAGDTDIAVTFADSDVSRAQLIETTRLLREPMFFASSLTDQLAGPGPIRLEEASDRHWIVGSDNTGLGLIRRSCLAAGFEPRISARLDQQPAIQGAVAAGIGVTLLPALATVNLLPGIALREIASPEVQRRVLAHTIAGLRTPAITAGLEALRATARRFSTRIARGPLNAQ